MQNLRKTTSVTGVTLFQNVHETAQGGFTLDKANLDPALRVLPGGSVISYDEATRKAFVVKSATLQAAAGNTDTVYRVLKGHNLKVGEFLGAKVGSKSYDITAIDTTNTAYDQVTLSTTLGAALTLGTALFQAKGATATTSAFSNPPKGLLYEDTHIDVNTEISVVIRGTVYARRIPGVAADVQAVMPLIIFSQSY